MRLQRPMNNQGGMGGYGAGGGAGPPGQQPPGPPGQPQYHPAPGQQPPFYQGGYGGAGGAPGAAAAAGLGGGPNPMAYANSPQQQYARQQAGGSTAPPPGGGYGGYYGGGGQPGPTGGPQGYMQHGQPPQQQQPGMYGMQQQPQMSTSGASGMYGSGPSASSAPPPNTNFGMTPSYSSSSVSSAPFGAAPVAAGAMPQMAPFGAQPGSGMLQQPPPMQQQPVQPPQQQPAAAAPVVLATVPVAAAPTMQHQMATTGSSANVAMKVPNPYSADILDHLERFSVPDLCAIGRELIADLNYRTASLCATFKSVSERKPYSLAPEPQLEYCAKLLKKIVEIRLRIEKNMPKKRLTADDFIEMLRVPGEPTVSDRVKDQEEIFAANRKKLINLSSDLKMLDWLAQVADPSHLKKTDGMPRKDTTKPGVI